MIAVAIALVLLYALFDTVMGTNDTTGESALDKARLLTAVGGSLLAFYPVLLGFSGCNKRKRNGHSVPHRKRVRRTIHSIFDEMGPTYVRRAYRMHEYQFWKLHRLLEVHLGSPVSTKKRHRNGGKNGIITTDARLSCALRYFAGGRPDDIAVVHGISHSEVFNSVWKVVNAVNSCDELSFSFPETHEEQRFIAGQFERKSKVGFKGCAGAIDGMLIWIEKPTLSDCEMSSVGQKKFFCGRKHKFGLNLMATCDTHRRFLDISVKHPASTSDYLAFSTSSLYHLLEKPGFLADGLCLFGDNAYVNTTYMATPFRSVTAGDKDSYNFYHSSLRMAIECCFGMLVNRWSILRRALPASFGLDRIPPLIMTLCRLHNFLIEERLATLEKEGAAPLLYTKGGKDSAIDDVDIPLVEDALEVVAHGRIPLVSNAHNSHSPEQLLHKDRKWGGVSIVILYYNYILILQ